MKRTLSLLVLTLAVLAAPTMIETETTKTSETTSVQHQAQPAAHVTPAPRDGARTDSAPDWACWAEGNRRCSVLPLTHRSTSSAVCEGDADCDAWWSRAVVAGRVAA